MVYRKLRGFPLHSKYQFQSFNLCLLFYLNLPFVRVQKNCRDFLQVSFVSVSPILISVPHCTFLSISCCSIFKDHSYQVFLLILSLTRDLYIISYLEAFVKRFFKRFLSFFKLSCFFRFGRFWLTLILYHIFDCLSRGFAKVFSGFFQPPARRLRLADSLFSIPYLFRIVNSLFDIFFSFGIIHSSIVIYFPPLVRNCLIF